MPPTLQADSFDAAAHSAMAAHLTGPFQAGAVDSPLTVQANGTVVVDLAAREPVLLVAPLAHLGDRRLIVTAVLDPAGAATPILPALEFAPFSEAGAYLPLYAPAVDPDTRATPPFSVRLAVSYQDRDGNPLPAGPAGVDLHVTARLVEGVLGKVLYVMGAEKARMRRQAREIAAMRAVSESRWDALDRHGADLGVPRFSDELRYDAAKKEIYTEVVKVNGEPVPESDVAYRRRLKPFAALLMPTRRRVLELLNGPGSAASPNAGPIGELGLVSRFLVEERNNAFAVGVHLVSSAGPTPLQNFHEYLRRNLLVWPAAFPPASDPHRDRLLNSVQRQRLEDQRARLRAAFSFSTTQAIAPSLAAALDRVGRLRSALGVASSMNITRAFDPAAGSRYELGLGVDIQPIPASQLNALHTALSAVAPPTSPDPEIAALIGALRGASKPAATDPEGAWLLQAAGLRTVHRVASNRIYLSSLPTFGLVVSESALQPGGGVLALEAHYHAPGDPGANAVLEAALTSGAAAWAAQGREAWTRIADTDAKARWNGTTAQPAAVRNVFAAAGLPSVPTLPSVATALNNVPPELVEAIQLGPTLTTRIFASDPAAVAELQALAALFRNQGLSAILPFVSGPNQVTVLLGAIGLPGAGINLSDRLATGFRWYAAPIQGAGGEIKVTGARSVFRPTTGAVLTAIVVIGYARRGLVDPYEFRVELPAGALLSVPQYEFLMNTLERVCPIGVQANTFTIRQGHVDLDANGTAEPLPPSLFRTYRKFHRRHQRGEIVPGTA